MADERGAAELFDAFVSSSTCRAALCSFGQLCERLQLERGAAPPLLYRSIRARLRYWRADALWAKLEQRAARREYRQAGACRRTTVGAAPLRAALLPLTPPLMALPSL